MRISDATKLNRIAWMTDLHLDFAEDTHQIERFCQNIVALNPDAVFIGKDIAIAATLEELLLILARYGWATGEIAFVRK